MLLVTMHVTSHMESLLNQRTEAHTLFQSQKAEPVPGVSV